MTAARLAAARSCSAVERGRRRSRPRIDGARARSTTRDRALLLELAAGTLRWRNELDAVITALPQRAAGAARPGGARHPAPRRLSTPPSRPRPGACGRQRIGGGRTPARSAGAAGFVNAVLRDLVEEEDERSYRAARPPATAGRTLSLVPVRSPCRIRVAGRPLARSVGIRRGRSVVPVQQRAARSDAARRRGLRSTRARSPSALTGEGIDARRRRRFVRGAVRLAPGALGRLRRPARRARRGPGRGVAARRARSPARGPASACSTLCAAPGGKTIILSEPPRWSAASWSPADDRARACQAAAARRCRKLRRRPACSSLDADARVAALRPVFDCVLLDAPCSGLGTFRRDPDHQMAAAPGRPSALRRNAGPDARHAAELVAPGRPLIYATCSSEPEENDAVVDSSSPRHPRFRWRRRTSRAGATCGCARWTRGRPAHAALHTRPRRVLRRRCSRASRLLSA